jgi:hypothetical protein
MPKDITPKHFELCKRKKWTVVQALHNDEWIRKLSIAISIEHLTQFVQLVEGVDDDISWKLTPNGQYSAAFAYKLQLFGLIESCMNKMVWKVWAPPKVKNHAWLALQNRIWMAIKEAWAGQLCDLLGLQTNRGDQQPPLRLLPLHR